MTPTTNPSAEGCRAETYSVSAATGGRIISARHIFNLDDWSEKWTD